MTQKYSFSTFLKFINTLLIILILTASPLSAEAPQLLLGKKYFDVTHELLQSAEKSIDIYMYFIIADENAKNPVNILVDDLTKAKQRGVDVKVFLEDRKMNENKIAYDKLMRNGIDVNFDTPGMLLHAKNVIIDNKYCIIGSTNWTRAAIEKNYETSILIDSEQIAESIKDYFSKIETTAKPILSIGVSIPYEFLVSPEMGPKIFKDHASNALDLYLLLLKKSRLAGSNTIKFNYSETASQLGHPEFSNGTSVGKDKTEYDYLKLRKPFRALKSKYHLIDYNTLRERKVVLLPVESTQSFTLPYTYWDYNYAKSLSLRAKYMYLISLLETHKNKDYPFWFRSNKSLSSIYNISTNSISLGFMELERENIIEITRSTAIDEKYEDRGANIYKLNKLISPKKFNLKLYKLSRLYGAHITRQAVYLASQLNDPKDIEKITTFIKLIKKYGYRKVSSAVNTTTKHKKGTGLYSMETVHNLL